MNRKERQIHNPTDGVSSKKSSSGRVNESQDIASSRKPSIDMSRTSSGNVQRRQSRSTTTAAEAAAKLSMSWPPRPENKAKTTTEGSSLSNTPRVRVNPSFMNEMRNLLHSNTEISTRNPSLSQRGSARSLPLKGPVGSDAGMTPSEYAQLQQKLDRLTKKFVEPIEPERKYKPFAPPKWEEVESMWPGFDHKPVSNWQNYAIPPKVEMKANRDKSRGRNGRSKASKASQRPNVRIISHCGGCQY